MADITIAVEETSDAYSTWTHVFAGLNNTWLSFDTRQILGNFFIGLQGQTMNCWDAQIPRGSTILSATMEVTAYQNSAVPAFTGQITAPKRSADNHRLLPMQLPFSEFIGWRTSFWSNTDIDLNDSVGGDIIETSGGVNNRFWQIKQLLRGDNTVPTRELLAQIFTMPTSASNIIGSATLQMARVGTPAGSCRILVQGITLNRGVQEPDGITIATSDDILQSAIPAAPSTGSPISFMFTGGDQIALTVGTDYALVFDSDNTIINNADYVTISHQDQFFVFGRQMHFGGGLGNDWQNYPGTVDANFWHTNDLNFIISDIPWVMPRFFTGLTYTSPDITELIQAQIDDSGYVKDAGVIVGINRGAPTANNRVWGSNQHATLPGPILRVTYRPRRAGITQGQSLIERKPTGGFWFDYDRERYRRDEERKRLLDLELKALFVEDKLERKIALEFRKDEEEENRLIELSMLTKLVNEHQKEIEESFNEKVIFAANRAILQHSYSTMERLERTLNRELEEEQFLLITTQILLDQ